MRVVLSGYYGFNNVGDEAILYSIIQALRYQNAEIGITVLSNNPKHTMATYGVEAVNRWNLKEIRSALKDSDGLISGGGSLLQDQTGPKSIPYYIGVMKLAQWLGKPVFIYAQGMGPFNKAYNKWIIRWTLNKTKAITVRDIASKKLLESINVKKSISVVPDPVMGIQTAKHKGDWLNALNLSGQIVTVSVREWPTTFDYKQQIAKALDLCVEDNLNVVFVPMHGKHDDMTSQEIKKLMKEKSYVAPHDATIEDKMAIIGKSDVLVGMRLHSLIFAAVNSVPFIALSYDPKIDGFAELCHQPILGHVNEGTWDYEKMSHSIKEVLDQKEVIKQSLYNQVEPLKMDAAETARIAINCFK